MKGKELGEVSFSVYILLDGTQGRGPSRPQGRLGNVVNLWSQGKEENAGRPLPHTSVIPLGLVYDIVSYSW